MRRIYYVLIIALITCISGPFLVWAVPKESQNIRSSALDEGKSVFYTETVNPQEWEEWFKGQKKYIQKTQDLFKNAVDIEKVLQNRLQKPSGSYDNHWLPSQIEQAQAEISRIIGQMQAITPSPELLFYHNKMIASCQYMVKQIEAYAHQGVRYASYKLTSMTLAMDAIAWLKNTYHEHGASQQELDSLNKIIEEGFFEKNELSEAKQGGITR